MLTVLRRMGAFALSLLLTMGFGFAEGAFPLSFSDSTDAVITLFEPPRTVCVLFSSYAEIWTLAGGEVSITVGESVERGFADSEALLVDEGAGHNLIDLETLIKAQPDLVIGTVDYACQRDAVEFCRCVDIPAALFRVESFDDYLTVLRTFTSITGRDDLYRQNGEQIACRISALFERVNALKGGERPRFLFVRAGSSARSTKPKTDEEHFACRMLAELGAENIANSDQRLSGEMSLETIVREDPDFLFISLMGNEDAARDYVCAMLASDGWEALRCVRSGRWQILDKDLFHYKPNARWDEAYEALAALLYPALMS